MNQFEAENALFAQMRDLDDTVAELQAAEAEIAYQVESRPVPPELVRSPDHRLAAGHVAFMNHVEFTPNGAIVTGNSRSSAA